MLKWSVCGLVAAVVLVACARSPEPVSTSKSLANFTARWPSTEIPVCWEASALPYPAERGWVRAKIAAAYDDITPLRFIGWGMCTRLSREGLRIAVADTEKAPHTQGVGEQVRYIRSGMTLNFDFTQWSKSACSGSNRRFCIESVAVHEFGHAAGLEHEQDRVDHPADCGQQGPRLDDSSRIGDYDPNSAMNYCNHLWNNGGKLSSGDLHGLAVLYRDVPRQSLRGDDPEMRGCHTGVDETPLGSPASLNLINATRGTVRTGWLDEQLQVPSAVQLQMGTSTQWTTMLGRSYVAHDADGRCIGLFTVKAAAAKAVIHDAEDFIPVERCAKAHASAAPQTATQLTVHNQSTTAYALYWINEAGKRVALGSTKPGTQRSFNTDTAHVLMLADASDDTCQGILLPSAEAHNFVID